MRRRRKQHPLRSFVLLLGVLTLGVVVIRWQVRAAQEQGISPSASTQLTPTLPELLPPTITLLPTSGTASQANPAIPESPADAWANALLDRALPLLRTLPPPTDDLVWWRSADSAGLLTLDGDVPTLDGMNLPLTEQQSAELYVVDQSNPNFLHLIGEARIESGTLILNIPTTDADTAQLRWLLSSGTPELAVRSLVVQAERRGIRLHAAFAPEASTHAQLVLVSAATPEQSAEVTATTTSGDLTSIPTRTSLPPVTLTPTRPPEAYLGGIVAEKIDSVITSSEDFNAEVIFSFIERHPWVGELAILGTEITIAGRAPAVLQATELTFYTLQEDDPSGAVTRFLRVAYTEDGTTSFPDDLIYFQGQRMEEILYWMIVRAAERGGQLIVAYDDFGAKQAITVIGFRPFPN